MSTEGPGADDRLLERLRQSASGDPAVRQLRRRYDLLRNDYEHLIDRLGELEDRLAATQSSSPDQSVPLQLPSAAPLAEPVSEPASPTMLQDLVAPLLDLRDEYLAAVAGIQEIVSGLDGLAAAAFKGQHPPAPGSAVPQAPSDLRPRVKPSRLQVEVKGRGFGQLLDFQEQISAIPGVARVSINAIDNERANLVVELEADPIPD